MTDIILDTAELDRLVSKLGATTEKIFDAIAFDIEGIAKQLCPVDTGALRNSIHTRTKTSNTRSGKDQGAEIPAPSGNVQAVIGTGMEYAEYVEFGTSRAAAQPYLTPAVESVSGKLNSGETYKELFS